MSIAQAPPDCDADLVAIIDEVRAAFLRTARCQVEEAARALVTQAGNAVGRVDPTVLARTIHTIKGTAGSVGLPNVSAAASEVEGALRCDAGSGAALQQALERLARLIRDSDTP